MHFKIFLTATKVARALPPCLTLFNNFRADKNSKPLFLRTFMNLAVGSVEERNPTNENLGIVGFHFVPTPLDGSCCLFQRSFANKSGNPPNALPPLCRETLSVVVHGGNQRQSPATGNPFGLRQLLYAGKPVHRNGLPSTALAPQDHTTSPPQWLPNLHLFLFFQSDRRGLKPGASSARRFW